MISVFVEKESIKGNIVEIREKQDINHLKNSFRMKAGDKLRVVDGEFEYMCRIVEVEKKEILAEIEEKIEDRYSTEAEIDIAQGLLKNDKMDLTIQKLTEIGINRIIPMVTERTVVKVKEKKTLFRMRIIVDKGGYISCLITSPRLFYFDYLGSQVSQQLGAIGSGN